MSGIEWILIITMHLSGPKGHLESIETSIIQGFTTKEKCETSKKAIALQIGGQVGKHREQQGIPGNKKLRVPTLNGTCLMVEK